MKTLLIQNTTSRILIVQISQKFQVEKNEVAQKIAYNSAFKEPESLREVSNRSYRLRYMYEIIHIDIKALGFSRFSIKIRYI